MKKSVTALTLSFIMLFTAIAGQAPAVKASTAPASATPLFNATGFPIVDEPITLTLFGRKAALDGPYEEMEFWKHMADLTNISFIFDTPPQDSFAEKKNLLFASNNLPDVFMGGDLTPSDEVNYGGQGLLIPLDPLIDAYGVNLLERFSENVDMRRNITTNDGHIYTLPIVNTSPRSTQDGLLWVNYKWLDALNVERDNLPNTIEDLHDLLVRFRDEDPNGNKEKDERPITFSSTSTNNIGMRWFFMNALGITFNDDGFYVDDDGKVLYQFNTKTFRDYLTMSAQWYGEALIDQDVFTQTTQQRTANGKGELIGIFATQLPGNIFNISSGEDSLNYPILPVLTSADNSTPIKRLNNTTTRGKFAISNKNKYPEATLRFADYFFSKEGSMTIYQGVEGENWEYIDNEKIKWRSLVPDGMNPEEYRFKHTPDCGPKFQFPEIIKGKTNPAEVYADNQGFSVLPYAKSSYPVVYFTEQEQARISIIKTDLDTYLVESEAKFITGQMPLNDDNWNKFVSTLESIGVTELTGHYQAAYDRWSAN